MKDKDRCSECGSWGVECANEIAVTDCGCARCLKERIRGLLNADIPRMQARIRDLETKIAIAEAFHSVAVKERDYERTRRVPQPTGPKEE